VGQSVDLVARVRAEDLETEEDQRRREEEEEDEKLVREVFSKVSMPIPPGGSSDSSQSQSEPTSQPVTVKRKAADVEPEIQNLLPESTRELIKSKAAIAAPQAKKPKPDLKSKLGIKVAKKGKVAV